MALFNLLKKKNTKKPKKTTTKKNNLKKIGCWVGGIIPDSHFVEDAMADASYGQKWSFVVFVAWQKVGDF